MLVVQACRTVLQCLKTNMSAVPRFGIKAKAGMRWDFPRTAFPMPSVNAMGLTSLG